MDKQSTTLKKAFDRLAGNTACPHSLLLSLGDCIISVRTNAPGVAGALRSYFSCFLTDIGTPVMHVLIIDGPSPALPYTFTVKQPDPGKSKIKEEFVEFTDGRLVRKRLTGMLFFFGSGLHAAIGPCRENLNQVVNFINNRFIQWKLDRGWLLGHAAAVSLDGCGIAVAGISGAGKSTLALHLMQRGAVFVSNDRLLIRRTKAGLSMAGVAKLPRINPGTALYNPCLSSVIPAQERDRFLRLCAEELWTLEHKYDVDIESIFGSGSFELFSPLHALVILNWHRAAAGFSCHAIRPAEQRELLRIFIKSPGIFYQTGAADSGAAVSEDVYIKHLSPCPVYVIEGGADFSQACKVCENIKHMRDRITA